MFSYYLKKQVGRLLDHPLVMIWFAIAVALPLYHQLNSAISTERWNTQPTAYQIMIGFDFSALSSEYYMVLPLFAGLIGVCALADKKFNHSELIEMTRVGKKKYVLANALATFLVGGFALTSPLILDALIALSRVQGRVIDAFSVVGQPIDANAYYFRYFLANPLLFLGGYWLLTFIVSGLSTVIAFLVFKLTRRRALGVLSVFIAWTVEWIVGPLCRFAELAPAIFLIPSQGYNRVTSLAIGINLTVDTVALIVLMARAVKSDEIG
ncbi:MAG: hypothetical protein ABF743_11280 [Schleiferilactobacillus perolens]|uniref:hypothetical protein n=1 Tax=Schleiferilactobacillus perolens TaxID=100468 RepID=UPI0039E789CE|nr:hypothetical protein [Schleiferilactobacillus harbinensis]MCI1913799.1 hypothetical protein [Schleiferilactobacillus harbinensis]